MQGEVSTANYVSSMRLMLHMCRPWHGERCRRVDDCNKNDLQELLERGHNRDDQGPAQTAPAWASNRGPSYILFESEREVFVVMMVESFEAGAPSLYDCLMSMRSAAAVIARAAHVPSCERCLSPTMKGLQQRT